MLFALPCTAWLFELLIPSRCASCGEPGPLFCGSCLCRLVPVNPPLCARCGAPTAWPVERCRECAGRRIAFTTARAGFVYVDVARPFVRGWKERGARPLAAMAAMLVAERLPCPAADVITYIPPDGDRSLRRGHQPAEGLARELGVLWGLPVARLLARRRRVARQTGLPRVERERNMRGAFVARERVQGRVVLVDDVYTTGATVSSAATALRAAGASTIDVVTLARAVRGR
jgi:predicted amidophosphoribosyltransferase